MAVSTSSVRAEKTTQLRIQIQKNLADIHARINRAGALLTPKRQDLLLKDLDAMASRATDLVETKDGQLRADSVIERNLAAMRALQINVVECGAIVDNMIASAKRRAKGNPGKVTVTRRPGELVPGIGGVTIPGFKFMTPDFAPLAGFTVRRPRSQRTRIGYLKAGLSDITIDSNGVAHLGEQEIVDDNSPSFGMMDFGEKYGISDGQRLMAPHLVLEVGSLDDNSIAHHIINKGIVDAKGRKWLSIEVSGSGQRQGKLFLWPEELAPLSKGILMGDWSHIWIGKKIVPSKAVAYLALGFSSLSDWIQGELVFVGADIRVVPDVDVRHKGIKAVKQGRTRIITDHTATVTDGVIAIGSNVMRRLEAALGYPTLTLHAAQIRGDLGTAIKGLLVEYTEIAPDSVLVFESATKLTKDSEIVAEMLIKGRLGIVRANRMTDNLTGVTTLSKQVLGLLPRGSLGALAMAKAVAKGVADNSLSPQVIQAMVGLIDADYSVEEIVENAAKDGNVKKAVLAANPELAIQDRSVRRYVGDMMVDRIKRQGMFGNLLVAGYDLWQAPDPMVVKATELGLIKGPVSVGELKKLAKQTGVRYLKEDQVAWAGAPKELNGKQATLLRHPMQHPAQLALAEVVKMENDRRWGLVFLSASSMYQAIMGGSDFDGDEIKLSCDEQLVAAVVVARGVMDYIILPPDAQADKISLTEEAYPEMLRQVLHRSMDSVGQIGILSNLASIASALCLDDHQRELLLSVIAFLVMVAVDAVKTGVKANPREYLSEMDLVGSPLEFTPDGDLRAKKDEDVRQRPVWLGQPAHLRGYFAKIDRTEMPELYMGQDDLVALMAGSKKDSNDKKVAQQLLRIARGIMAEPNDLRELAKQIVELLPEKDREECLHRLESLRQQRNEAQWAQRRADAQAINKQIADAKWNLADLMKVPTVKARRLLSSLGRERSLVLASVIYDIRPSAAWSFCGPEMVDLFARAAGKSVTLTDYVVQSASIKVVGMHHYGFHPDQVVEMVRAAKKVTVHPVDYGGGKVSRVFVEDMETHQLKEIGQVSAEFEPYAQHLYELGEVPVDPEHCGLEKRTLVIRFMPPQVGDPGEVWLESALLRIQSSWSGPVLEGTVARLREEYKMLENPPTEIRIRMRDAIAVQRAAAGHAELMDKARTVDELTDVGRQIGATGLPEDMKELLKQRFLAQKDNIEYGLDEVGENAESETFTSDEDPLAEMGSALPPEFE